MYMYLCMYDVVCMLQGLFLCTSVTKIYIYLRVICNALDTTSYMYVEHLCAKNAEDWPH